MEADMYTGVNSLFCGAIATFVQRCLFCSYTSENYSEENMPLLSTGQRISIVTIYSSSMRDEEQTLVYREVK